MPVAPTQSTDGKTCPDCAEFVRAAANKCRFCGNRFEPSEHGAETAQPGNPSPLARSAALIGR